MEISREGKQLCLLLPLKIQLRNQEYANACRNNHVYPLAIRCRDERTFALLKDFSEKTGARIEEFLNMHLSDIFRQENCVQLRLRGKGDKTRYIPLLDDVIPHLDNYLKEFHSDSPDSDFLIYTVHQEKHTQMTEGTVNHLLKKYASIIAEKDPLFPKDLHCHTMRHSISMAMYKKGVLLAYIKDFLGHANLNSVSIYVHSDNETVAEALEVANADLELH